mgnify:CR=1 FL=1
MAMNLEDFDDLTLEGLIELTHDPYLPGFEQLIPGLIDAYDAAEQPDPALFQPIETLRTWDMASGADSVAMTLAHFYGVNSVATGKAPEGLSQMERVNFYGAESPPADRLAVFAETVAMLDKDFGAWDTPWGEVNRFQRLSGDIDLKFYDEQPSVPIARGNSDWGAVAEFGSGRQEET